MGKQDDSSDLSYRALQPPAQESAQALTALAGYRLGLPTTREGIEAASRVEAWKVLRRDIRALSIGMAVGQLFGMLTRPNPTLMTVMHAAVGAVLGLAVTSLTYWLVARRSEKSRIERMLEDPASELRRYYERLLKRALKRLTGTSGEFTRRIVTAKQSKSIRVALERDALMELQRQVDLTTRFYRQTLDRLGARLDEYELTVGDGRALLLDEIDQLCGWLELHGRALKELGKQLRQFDALGMDLATFIAHAKISVQGLPRLPRLELEAEPAEEGVAHGDGEAEDEAAVTEVAKKRG